MERKTGALISPVDYRDYKSDILAGVSTINEKVVLPETYLLPQHLLVKNQGNVNSCVAHSLSSAVEAKDEGTIYSTGWIYGYRPTGYWQGQGMYMREAIKTITNLGAVKNEDFDVNVEMKAAKEKVDNYLTVLESLADEKKVSSYARLNSIDEIKAWIMIKQMPVPLCILVDDMKLDKNNIIQIPKKTYGGHAILAIGWNENGLIIQNSWGDDWGYHGTATLPYEYQIQEAWGLEIDTNIENTYKPSLYLLRRILQWIINLLREGKNNGNK